MRLQRVAAAATSQRAFAQALLDVGQDPPLALHTWNGSDAGRRLAVYRNNVVSSLVEALAQTFPVTEQLVGAAFFRVLAALFVRQHPPTSRILACYGQRLPAFIACFEPAAGLPYLPDMARLEFARVQAYHAGDADAIGQEALAQVLAQPEAIPAMHLELHPSVQVLASRHGVVSLWQAHQQEGDMQPIDITQGESALVLRQGLDVLVVPASPGTASFVCAVKAGTAVGDAAAKAFAAHPSFDLSTAFAQLLSRGAIHAFRATGAVE